MAQRIDIDEKKFYELASKRLNCKQIADALGIHPRLLGKKAKQFLGVYPSQYLHQQERKNG